MLLALCEGGRVSRALHALREKAYPHNKRGMFFIELQDQDLVSVGYELFSRDHGYVALDRRRQYLFAGTSLRNVREGIDLYAHEEVGRTAMFESAARTSRRGYAGSFKFERCHRSELPALVRQHRGRHQRVVLCASRKGAWTLGETAVAPRPETDDVVVVESDYITV